MEIKTGKYVMLKDGRTIFVQEVRESEGKFIGNDVSRAEMEFEEFSLDDIDHIAR